MINLIPPTVRKTIVLEYWTRVFSVALFMLSVVSLALTLFALPVYVLVTSQVEVYGLSATETSEKVAEYDLSANSLVAANRQAQKIVELRNLPSFTAAQKEIEAAAPAGISFGAFEFSRAGKDLAPVAISGVAQDRQALASFREALLSKNNIKEAVLPISNLAKDKDIEFSIQVTFKTDR